MWGRKYDIWCWLGMNYLWQVILTFTLNAETYHCPEQRYKAQEGGSSVSWLLLCNGLCAWVKQDRREGGRGGARSSHSSGWSDWRCYSPLQPSHLSAGSSLQVQWGQVTQTEAAFLSQNPLQLHGSWTIQALDHSMSSASSATTRFQLWETMWADMNYFEKHEFPTSVYLVLCWVGLFVDRLAFSVKKMVLSSSCHPAVHCSVFYWWGFVLFVLLYWTWFGLWPKELFSETFLQLN